MIVAATSKPDAPPTDFDLEGFVPYLLNRLANRLNLDLLEALREIGLGTSEWRVLAVLRVRDGLSLTDLAVLTITGQSTLSRVVDRMIASGLVERRRHSDDARIAEVFLTAAGEAAFARVWPVARTQYQRAVQGIPDEEMAAFTRTLGRMLHNVRKTHID